MTLAATELRPADARFTARTSNTGNTLTAGTVVLAGTAPAGGKVFDLSNAIPGSTGAACIITTYTGSLAATVRMYVPSTAGTLGSYLTFRLQLGTGSNTDCSDFSATSTLYNATGMAAPSQTLTAFVTGRSDWANGVGSWAATTNTSRTWKFEWLLQGTDAAQGQSVSFTARWEAQR